MKNSLALSCLLLCLGLVHAASISPLVSGSASDDLIRELPGLDGKALNFKQYSGYLDAGNGIMLHYWFVESQSSPADDPVLLWLNGGPGCSSMDGLLNELGPVHVKEDGKTLYVNDYAWNTFANVMFMESPACVGFSYSTRGDCSASDNSTAQANFNALVNFFKRFPQFSRNDFYVTGESYGGIYVPTLTLKIAESQKVFPINLKGFAVGNGLSSWEMNDNSIVFFGNYHGLFGKVLWDSLVDHCCDSDIPTPQNCHFSSNPMPLCQQKVQQAFNLIYDSGLNMYNLYGLCEYPKNSSESVRFGRYHADARLVGKNLQRYSLTASANLDPPCTDSSAMSGYLNSPEVRKAIHIPDSVGMWYVCNDEVNAHFKTQYQSMDGVYQQLQRAGVRGLIYNGDVDMACNFIGDQWFAESLDFKEVAVRRPWYHNRQVGGFVKQFELLDLVTIRGAGHMVPQDKPGPSLHMIKTFVQGGTY